MSKAILTALALALSFSLPAYSQSQGAGQRDAKFLKEMADGDMAEVAAGELAAQKAASDDVKKFAEQMQEDHGKHLSEAQDVAKAKGIQLPSEPAKKHQAQMKKLESASAGQFDQAYMKDMVKDHKEDLKKLRAAAKNAKDPEIKAAAEKAIPVVQGHLRMAEKITSGMGRASKGSSAGTQSSSGASSGAGSTQK